MAKCSQCGAETPLYVNGVPLCLECDKKRLEEKEPRPPTKQSGHKSGSRPG
jgi:hypothetical protein